jgi:transcriptional regulator with XRE-family HTH domain|nr:MAG TPA: helix-turn-helix domain protein [Bacteriophage sp.]
MSFRSARHKAGFSVQQVADALKISDVAVYYWETGQLAPRASRLPEIATLYGCTVDELLKPDEEN